MPRFCFGGIVLGDMPHVTNKRRKQKVEAAPEPEQAKRNPKDDPDFVPPQELTPVRLFFFEGPHNNLVPMNEIQACKFGNSMREYLGMLETSDTTILEKTVAEVKKMKLKKVQPTEMRRTPLNAAAARLKRYGG